MGGYFPWVERYVHAKSINEAVSILNEAGGAAAVVAGGTSVSMRLPARVKTLMDLNGLGLDRITRLKTGVEIGAMVSLRSLETVLADNWGGVIAEACQNVGTRLVRNAATIGGEMAAGLPWCDLPVVMAALNADVMIAGRDQAIPAVQWTLDRPADILKNTIITGLNIPKRKAGQGLGFYKVTRVHGEYGAAVAGAWVEINDNRIIACRVVAGSVSPHPVELDYVEDAIIGRDVNGLDIDTAIEPIEQRFNPAGDPRFSKEYRRDMMRVAVRRALLQAMAQGGE